MGHPTHLSQRPLKSRGAYYAPPGAIRDVPGVTKSMRSGVNIGNRSVMTFYRGSATDLCAAGLLPIDLFPGGAKCPSRTAISYRPLGANRSPHLIWYEVPGYMTVRRNPGGDFVIGLTVSAEEQAHRAWRRELNEAPGAAEAIADLRDLLRTPARPQDQAFISFLARTLADPV